MSTPHSTEHRAPLTPPTPATAWGTGERFDATRASWKLTAFSADHIAVATHMWGGAPLMHEELKGAAHPPTDDRPWWLVEWADPQPPAHFTAHVQAMLADALPEVTA